MNKLLALARKEFLQVRRDPGALLIAFVLPLVLLFIYGYGVNLDSSRLRVGVVLEKSTPDGLSLLAAFQASRFFEVTVGRDRRELEDGLTTGRLRGLVVIPDDFSKTLSANGGQPVIQVIADGTEPNVANFVKGYAEGVAGVWLEQRTLDRAPETGPPPVGVEPRFWYNPELSSRNFLIPGSLAIVMTLIGVLLTSLVMAREWERGTMEALLSTPVTIRQIILAKLLVYYLLALVSMFMCWAVAVFWYGIPFRGSPGALWLVSSVFLTAALGQGLLISSVARDQFLASQLALVSGFLPAFILSGFIFEISSMPPAVQGVSLIVSARYFVSALQTIFLAGDVWPLFLRSMVAMGAIGLFFFMAAARKTGRRVA